MLRYSGGIVGSFFHTTTSGTARYSAKAPLVSTPRILTLLQMCICPVRHCLQCRQGICVSTETTSPSSTRLTTAPRFTTMPVVSWPTVYGTFFTRDCAHASHSYMWTSVRHRLEA